MKTRIIVLAFILLASLNVLTFIYTTQAVNKTSAIQTRLENNPTKIVYVEAKDGYTPIFGKDYKDGAPGINAVSYSVTKQVIQEVAIPGTPGKNGVDGIPGKDGIDGSYQEIRVNTDTRDIETKQSTNRFWETLVVCSEYRVECP